MSLAYLVVHIVVLEEAARLLLEHAERIVPQERPLGVADDEATPWQREIADMIISSAGTPSRKMREIGSSGKFGHGAHDADGTDHGVGVGLGTVTSVFCP